MAPSYVLPGLHRVCLYIYVTMHDLNPHFGKSCLFCAPLTPVCVTEVQNKQQPHGKPVSSPFTPRSSGKSINRPNQWQIHEVLPCCDRYPSHNKPLAWKACCRPSEPRWHVGPFFINKTCLLKGHDNVFVCGLTDKTDKTDKTSLSNMAAGDFSRTDHLSLWVKWPCFGTKLKWIKLHPAHAQWELHMIAWSTLFNTLTIQNLWATYNIGLNPASNILKKSSTMPMQKSSNGSTNLEARRHNAVLLFNLVPTEGAVYI